MRFRKSAVILLILTLLGIAAVSQSGGPGHDGGQAALPGNTAADR